MQTFPAPSRRKAPAAGPTRTATLPGDVLEFLRLLWALDHGLQTTSRRMKRAVGLTGPQRLVVRLAGWKPGISPGELAEILHLHRSSITSLLNGLVGAGYLQRRPNPLDRRGIVLSLTHRGIRANRHSAGTVEAAVRLAIAGIPPGRLNAAGKVLVALGEALSARGPKTTA